MNKTLKMTLLIVGAIIVGFITSSIVLGYPWGWRMHDMLWPGMMRDGHMWFMVIIWIAIIAVIIWAIVAITQKPERSTDPADPDNTALEVLKKRYARGEIEKEEYEAKKKDLNY